MTPNPRIVQSYVAFLNAELDRAVERSERGDYNSKASALDVLRMARVIAKEHDVECRMNEEGNIEWHWEGNPTPTHTALAKAVAALGVAPTNAREARQLESLLRASAAHVDDGLPLAVAAEQVRDRFLD